MKWTACPVGPIQANCYVLEDETTREALIIDPGGEMDRIRAIVEKKKLRPLAVLLTHAHFDHIGALEDARTVWKIPVWMHGNEAEWLEDPQQNGSARFPGSDPVRARSAEHLVTADSDVTIGPFFIHMLETPGHSPGGLSFFFEQPDLVFCGDTLFDGSIGRTDLPGGDSPQLLQSIREKLLTLSPGTVVCPGHGFSTTIDREIRSNPFLT